MTQAKIIDAPDRTKRRKMLFQMLGGGVSGAVGMILLLIALERVDGLLDDGARIFALGTALVFGLIGLLLAIGLALPGFGAKALNVENEAEIRQERPDLLLGTVSMIVISAFLFGLALFAGDGPTLLDRQSATIIVGLAALGLAAVGVAARGRGDEMMKAMNAESGGLAFTMTFFLFGGWAALAHLGHITMFSPLGLVAGMLALYLLAVFVTVARRGALTA